jgi:hypothetical protein
LTEEQRVSRQGAKTQSTTGLLKSRRYAPVCRLVIPAKAGIQGFVPQFWIPAFAGMTKEAFSIAPDEFF